LSQLQQITTKTDGLNELIKPVLNFQRAHICHRTNNTLHFLAVASGLTELVTEMIHATGDIGTQWILDLCNGFRFTFLIIAHPASPGQNPESRKIVVSVVAVMVL